MFARLILTLAMLVLGSAALAEVRVTDILGREVVLPAPARRIVLGEARHLSILGLLHDDPVALVAGWRGDKGLDAATLAAYRERFPAVADIRAVGAGNRDLSVEAIIGLAPDLVVLTLIDASDARLDSAREQLEAAGIPVAYVDFFSHPLENSIPSLRLFGAVTGAETRTEEFVHFYSERLDRIRTRLSEAAPERPDVFIHVHAAGAACCSTVGTGVFHDFVEAAGGHNIGQQVVPGVLGTVSLEFLLDADPDIYVATGGTHMAARGGLVLGPGVDAATARSSFDALLSAPGFSDLRAVTEGRVVGVWHLFNDSPAHIALIEYLAQTFHPDLFTDLDPAATLAEIERRFAPVAVPGIWWIAPR